MNLNEDLAALRDDQVLQVLGHLTEELGEAECAQQVTSADDARATIAALLAEADDGADIQPEQVLPDGAEISGIARSLLRELVEDEDAGPKAAPLIEDPPADEQMSVELAVAGVIVLGVLVTWLQTKVDLQIKHVDGKTSVDFQLHKDATDTELLKDLAKTVRRLLLL